MVRDTDSTNGIMVNGAVTSERVLEDGDVLSIGAIRFEFGPAGVHIWEPQMSSYNDRAILAALASYPGGAGVSLVLFEVETKQRAAGWAMRDALFEHVETAVHGAVGREDTFSRIAPDRGAVVGLDGSRIVDTLRRVVEQTPFVHDGRAFDVVIHVGSSTLTSATTRPWELLRHAEASLARARFERSART
ncbi:hypothetical protein BH11MYX2_BH11MYX2_19460 [soil metagenome]